MLKTSNIVLAVATAFTLATPLSAATAADQREMTRDIEAGPIWNQSDAERKCPEVAAREDGRWTGQWRTIRENQMSVCEIADRPWQDASRPPEAPRPYDASEPAAPLYDPAPARDLVRDVEAGPIWSQTDAEAKCPIAAYAVRGRWTGQWNTVEQGRMSVCKISDAKISQLAPIAPAPIAEAPPIAKPPVRTTRNVRAGLMMTQAEADSKCPSIAQGAHGQWTGKWWMPAKGEMAVCEISEAY